MHRIVCSLNLKLQKPMHILASFQTLHKRGVYENKIHSSKCFNFSVSYQNCTVINRNNDTTLAFTGTVVMR